MAKDPRFNFYVDNWIGGVEGFTLEQEGAYLSLIIMQSKIGRFTEQQAIDKLLQKTRGNTAVCTKLWNFLIPKFETDGAVYWSVRLETEMYKSKKHSQLQSERIKKRWNQESGITAVIPVNSIGSGNRSGNELKGVQGGKFSTEWFALAFDEIIMDGYTTTFREHNIKNELAVFQLKVRGSPKKYENHDIEGIRQAFIYQLTNSKATNGNNGRGQTKGNVRRADAIIEEGKDFGTL